MVSVKVAYNMEIVKKGGSDRTPALHIDLPLK